VKSHVKAIIIGIASSAVLALALAQMPRRAEGSAAEMTIPTPDHPLNHRVPV